MRMEFMNKAELERQLAAFGVRPGQHFGQNFMLDDNLLDFIVRTAAPTPGETILEVGPGFGALTERLLAAGARVVAVELDKRLADYLRRRFADTALTLVQGDACRVDLAEILGGNTGVRCIANLPYAITSPFLGRLLALPEPPAELLLMLQKETAQRMTAAVDTREYGSLTVNVQAVFEVSLLRAIPPEVFFPRPRVDSALVRFRRRPDCLPLDRRDRLQRVVRTAFSERRKMMRKALSRGFGEAATYAAMDALGIDRSARAQTLGLQQYVALCQHLDAFREEGAST
jgi:16S rRNA (adenine1518-N6/adenine1519-N6)-dimethyltransferase